MRFQQVFLIALCMNYLLAFQLAYVFSQDRIATERLFEDQIVPLLQQKCVRCHNDVDRKGELSLIRFSDLVAGGEQGPALVMNKPLEGLLWQQVTGESPAMPAGGPPLLASELDSLKRWLEASAPWPQGMVIEHQPEPWWSLSVIEQPAIPTVAQASSAIDSFIIEKLNATQLVQAPTADRRTLIRRLYFDLIGLPPSYDETRQFETDHEPDAYERLVDRLLASPRYGERWARHWLDIVHFGETHGYDKDKLRPNAWPYRDYVIRSLNEDRPYREFVMQQLAGDVLYPNSRDGIEALGFIAAGPWDFIGHAEVPETKIDGQIARHLDRDDMVSTTMSTFCSVTAHCAQCHNHKFDPITQEDYYALQAVFAAVDRSDRAYDFDPEIGARRITLSQTSQNLQSQLRESEGAIAALCGPKLVEIDKHIAEAKKKGDILPPQHGYHSQIAKTPDIAKWVQLDLGSSHAIQRIVWNACHDDFNGIGAGFGYPQRFKIEVSQDATFNSTVRTVVDLTQADVANPKIEPQQIELKSIEARFVRFTATRLAPRQNDYIFALAELQVFDSRGENIARQARVTAADSIEAPVRWGTANLNDGIYPQAEVSKDELGRLTEQRAELIRQFVPVEVQHRAAAVRTQLGEIQKSLDTLPPPQFVYAGTVHTGQGAFRGTGPDGGKPRLIHVLARGEVTKPQQIVEPGALSCINVLPARFSRTVDQVEGQRRAALANWITSHENPLAWRSIANRIWQYHFGRAIVDTPNDFGRMGQMPTHPQLLDWLAADIRSEQSLKRLHRAIVLSATYQAASEVDDQQLVVDPATIDADNQLYWRQNRQRLDAETIRDSMLQIAGLLHLEMGGPSFQDFVIEKPEHSPHYEYQLHDAENPATHRRSIYRFLVRSQQQPLMTVLDCADPSMLVDKRNQTISPLQALALLNNQMTMVASQHFATHLKTASYEIDEQVELAWREAFSRSPTQAERLVLVQHAHAHGLPSLCRMILNLNELVFAD